MCLKGKEMCFWGPATGERPDAGVRADPLSLETTAYALLQAVAADDTRYARKIASWLTEQRKFGGGFHSTQVNLAAIRYSSYRFNFQDQVFWILNFFSCLIA